MLEGLKEEVFQANLALPKQGLIKYTWGNVSAVDRQQQLFVIKPSGVDYETMQASDMVVCDFEGNVVEGAKILPPIRQRMPFYTKHFQKLWDRPYPFYLGDELGSGRTRSASNGHNPCRYVLWSSPLCALLTQTEIDEGYEAQTGQVIVETFKERGITPEEIPGVLLHGHGPFTWGKTADAAVMNAVVLEEVAKMNFITRQLNSYAPELPQRVLDKHYLRKHGENAYYGQNNEKGK